jgi:hypothetical protein
LLGFGLLDDDHSDHIANVMGFQIGKHGISNAIKNLCRQINVGENYHGK